MRTILQINSSLFLNDGQSTRLANSFAEAYISKHPDTRHIVRDLAQNPIPHLDAERFSAFLSKPEQRTATQQAILNESDALIEEIKQADEIIIGLPLYNLGIPSVLKAYFDHIARAGVTFRYTENGPVGLVSNKKVTIFAARGGVYVGTPLDTQTTYIKHFLNFIGITDITFIYAEGLSLGEEAKQQSLAKAHAELQALAA